MKRILALGSLMLAVALILPDAAQGQKRDGKNSTEAAMPQDYATLSRMTEITGRIVFADESSKTLSFRIDVPQLQANKTNKNPQMKSRGKGRVNPFRINPAMAYKIVTTGKDFELEVENKVTVQRRFLTVEYDDKGFVKNNKEEAATLGSKGYIPAKYEDVKSGMVATLYLNRPKASTNEEAPKPTVRMIVLRQAGNGPLQQAGAAAKKKNQ
jgi:hypothetical protein